MINTCHCERSEAIQPIYIDGVDVSKCKFYSEKLECRNGSGFIQVANGCGFCTHNIRGLDDADVYVQTFARCLNNECYYKELKARGRMLLVEEQRIRHWLREASDMGSRGFAFDYDEDSSAIPDEWTCFENMVIKDIKEQTNE